MRIRKLLLFLRPILIARRYLLFSTEGVTGLLALMFAPGSADEQCNSPFPREQEQQPIKVN